jgi:uncharacterized protein (DUF927 family)
MGFGVFDHAGPQGDAAKLAKAFSRAATSAYGTAGPEYVRGIINEGTDNVAAIVHEGINDFVASNVANGEDGQIGRAEQRLGLIAVAGKLATVLGVVPWQEGEASAAAAWALNQWIEARGGMEPAEVQQAIEQVRLFIEQHGESRFDPLNDCEAKPVLNRAGWRKGDGASREWKIPPETWRVEICAGLDPKMVARTLAELGVLERAADGFQPVRKIASTNKRVYIVNASIFDGGGNAS